MKSNRKREQFAQNLAAAATAQQLFHKSVSKFDAICKNKIIWAINSWESKSLQRKHHCSVKNLNVSP